MIEYIALSHPYTFPAAKYINKFIPMINSPTENPNFFDISNERISVPSREASFFRISPTPTPKTIPPKTDARITSPVTL